MLIKRHDNDDDIFRHSWLFIFSDIYKKVGVFFFKIFLKNFFYFVFIQYFLLILFLIIDIYIFFFFRILLYFTNESPEKCVLSAKNSFEIHCLLLLLKTKPKGKTEDKS